MSLIIFSTTFKLIGVMVFSWRYSRPMIFKYNFNWGSLEESTLLELMQFTPLTYCSIVCRYKEVATLLVTTMILAASVQIKSTNTLDLIFFNALFMLKTWALLSSMKIITTYRDNILFLKQPFHGCVDAKFLVWNYCFPWLFFGCCQCFLLLKIEKLLLSSKLSWCCC